MEENVKDVELRDEILNTLVNHRKDTGQHQIDVAARMGVGQPSISEFERGKVSPRISTLQRYARAVGMRLKLEVEKDDADAD